MRDNWTEQFVINNKIYRQFKKQQLLAESEKKTEYIFEGQEMLTKFGKYLLIYIENQRKQRGLQIWRVEA